MVVGERPLEHEVKTSPREVALLCSLQRPDGLPMALQKSIVAMADDPAVTVTYRLRWEGEEPLVGQWAVQWNLTLSAGEAPGRYYRVAGRPSLGSRGRSRGARPGVVDEWLAASWRSGGRTRRHRVGAGRNGSLSETGFERIYQGSALLFAWPLQLQAGQTWETSLRVAIGETAAGAAETRDSP